MHTRFPRWATAVLTAVSLLLGLAAAANADTVLVDGDGVVNVTNQPLALGNVCRNTTTTRTVLIGINRNGANNNSFQSGSNQSISFVNFAPPLAGGTATVAVTDAATSVPSNWLTTVNNNIVADNTASATITFTAGNTLGLITGAANFNAVGTSGTGAPLTRTGTVPVGGTVVNCDTAPPTLNLPSTVTVEATGPTGAVVGYTATATDAAPTNPTVSCAPASGSTFAIGTTPVSCSATDAAGNTATGSFNVVVKDTTRPLINGTPANLEVEATGPGGAVVTYTNPTATDIVDGSRPVTCTPTSGSLFPLGDSTITCSASDTRGNTATSSFTITVSDTTVPSLFLPSGVTAEATGPTGAAVSYTASASDTVDTTVVPSCAPPSGSTFAITTTPVGCTATDDSGNAASGSFTVTVKDTTPPIFNALPAPSAEATSPSGAVVNYAAVTATDLVDGTVTAGCVPPSGSTFALGSTTVTCTATDAHGNSAANGFDVVVVDTTPPLLVLPADQVAEATGPGGAAVSFAPATASDIVDTSVTVSCDAASGATFPLGATTVACTATDDSANMAQGQFTILVKDTTGPAITVAPAGNQTLEATGPGGAPGSYTASATDLVDGTVATTCAPPSGSTFAIATTTVTCSATDATGNAASKTFDVTVKDTTPPVITVPADITVDPTSAAGAAVTYTATATDVVDGTLIPSCTPASGSTFVIGTTTVGCSVTDVHGNSSSRTFKVTVKPLTLKGFYQPVDMSSSGTVYNTVKAGSTVPLKFEVFAGTTELTATSVVSNFTSASVTCSTGLEDAIEEIASTGGTSLRYDATGGQYIQNWQTPKSVGACLKVTMTTVGNTSLTAYFKLK